MSVNRAYRKKVPKWVADVVNESDPHSLGEALPFPPRVPTSIIPVQHANRVPAPFLKDIIHHTQNLVYYSALVAAYGPNPGYADLRGLDKDLKSMATLKVSAFSEGSFVIPAELEDQGITVKNNNEASTVTTSDIVDAFTGTMSLLEFTNFKLPTAINLPMGVLSIVEAIGDGLERHASKIIFSPSTYTQIEEKTVTVDHAYVMKAKSIYDTRVGKSATQISGLTGRLIGLDIVNKRVRIYIEEVDGEDYYVSGTFDSHLIEPLVERMAKIVTLEGTITYNRHKQPKKISIFNIDTEATDY